MSKDIYVRNLSPQTTEEDIRTLFAVAGKVTYIHMVIDQKTEQFLGCAYVKMSSETEAKDAISALNEARYLNAYISVTEAMPRTPPGSPRPPQARAGRPPATAAAAQKRQERSIAKGDWTGPAPAKKKERSAAPPWRQEGEEGRKSPADWTSKPAGAKKPWEKSTEKKEWTAAAPAKKERSTPPSWRKEGEEGPKSPADRRSKAVGAKKPWEKSMAESDWTAAAPAKKVRSSSPPWHREAANESATPARRKSSGPIRSVASKKGPGPKRGK